MKLKDQRETAAFIRMTRGVNYPPPLESDLLALSGPAPDPQAVPDPHNLVVATEFRLRLADGMRRLSDREKFVLWLYFCEGMRLHEIGDLLGVTESRVSKIRSTAVRRFRGERAPEVAGAQGRARQERQRLRAQSSSWPTRTSGCA
jgi:RNA polymerase sigma factor (sigma-70 family)